MTTVVAPSPTKAKAKAPTDDAQAKAKARALAKERLDIAIGDLCRHEEDGAPVLTYANRATWSDLWEASRDRRLALHAIIAGSPTDLSRRCNDGKDRAGEELADYLVGMRATRGDLKKDRRAWAFPKAKAPK